MDQRSYLDVFKSLDVNCTSLTFLHQLKIKSIHEDNGLKTRCFSSLNISQKHLGFLGFVADHCGDFSCNKMLMEK